MTTWGFPDDLDAPRRAEPAAVRCSDRAGPVLRAFRDVDASFHIYGGARVGMVSVARLVIASQSAAGQTCASLTTSTNSVKMTDTACSREVPVPRQRRSQSCWVRNRGHPELPIFPHSRHRSRDLPGRIRRSERTSFNFVYPSGRKNPLVAVDTLSVAAIIELRLRRMTSVTAPRAGPKQMGEPKIE